MRSKISLSPRLRACAEEVSEGGILLDIGTDHAYLPCFLVGTGAVRRAYASDVADGPLRSAERTAQALPDRERLVLLKSDGLRDIPEQSLREISDVVIAGMGGELICDILSLHGRLPDGVKLVLQPNTRAHVLRGFLLREGFGITRERAACEGGRSYAVICAERSEKPAGEPDELFLYAGRLDPRDPDAKRHLEREKARLERAARGMSVSPDPEEKSRAEKLFALAEKLGNYIER